jgi:hypothetical protein
MLACSPGLISQKAAHDSGSNTTTLVGTESFHFQLRIVMELRRDGSTSIWSHTIYHVLASWLLCELAFACLIPAPVNDEPGIHTSHFHWPLTANNSNNQAPIIWH